MHTAELSFICEPQKSWSDVNRSTTLYTVSVFVCWEVAKLRSTWQL